MVSRQIVAGMWLLITIVCAAQALAKPRSHTVYPIYTYAAGEWVAGRNIHVELPGYDFFRYSPTVAVFFVPWRLLGDAWGGALWRLCGMGMLAVGLWAWSKDVFQQRDWTNNTSWLFLLLVPLLLQNVNNGQANPHVLGAILIGTAELVNGRSWRSAMWLVVAGLFKPYLLAIPALLALVERRLRLCLVVALILGTCVPFACQTPSYVVKQYVDWVHHLSGNDRTPLGLRDAYRDAALLFQMYAVSLSPKVYMAISACVGLLMAGLVWRDNRATRPQHEKINYALALGCCWVTVFGPATEACTYLLLAPSLVAALLVWRTTSVRISYAMFVATIAASLFPDDWQVQVFGPQPLAGLAFLGAIIYQMTAVREQSIPKSQPLRAAA